MARLLNTNDIRTVGSLDSAASLADEDSLLGFVENTGLHKQITIEQLKKLTASTSVNYSELSKSYAKGNGLDTLTQKISDVHPDQIRDNAEHYSEMSRSYCSGDSTRQEVLTLRPHQDEDNAKSYCERAEAAGDKAVTSKNEVAQSALKAEGFAVGTQGGEESDTYAENNAKRLSEKAAASSLEAEGFARGSQNGTPAVSGEPYFENNAKSYYERAKEWAQGGTDGTPSATNNARYYCEKAEAAAQRAQQYGLYMEFVDELPTEEISTRTIYMVPNGTTGDNICTEYVYANGRWEIIGSTQIDLSHYVTSDEVGQKIVSLTKAQFDALAQKDANTYYNILDDNVPTVVDEIPTKDSKNIPLSGGVYEAIGNCIPAGVMLPFAGATAPTGFLLCQGQEVSRATYAKLFAAIGTSWGAGDGSTTFNLPDSRDRVFQGANGNLGTYKKAGLPNITGAFTAFQGSRFQLIGINSSNGAFFSSDMTDLYGSNGDAEAKTSSGYCGFDASRSSAIYGKSDTVQMAAACINYIIRY